CCSHVKAAQSQSHNRSIRHRPPRGDTVQCRRGHSYVRAITKTDQRGRRARRQRRTAPCPDTRGILQEVVSYEAEQDPLCYPATATLINLAGLTDQAVLDDFELSMYLSRAEEPLPHGDLGYEHYL